MFVAYELQQHSSCLPPFVTRPWTTSWTASRTTLRTTFRATSRTTSYRTTSKMTSRTTSGTASKRLQGRPLGRCRDVASYGRSALSKIGTSCMLLVALQIIYHVTPKRAREKEQPAPPGSLGGVGTAQLLARLRSPSPALVCSPALSWFIS